MSDFLKHYIIAALWSSTDADGVPMDTNYSADNLSAETRAAMRADCLEFQKQAAGLYLADEETRAAHDFWLTRNGHGAGFWDGDWKEPAASALDKIARSFGQFDLDVYRGRVSGTGPIKYLDAAQFEIVRTAAVPANRSRTGYGRKLPTQYAAIDRARPHVKRRVYAICYSNAASLYVLIASVLYFLRDSDIPENPRVIGLPDRRYAVRLEHCGASTRRHVLRFCGQFLSSWETKEQAETAAREYQAGRDRILTGGDHGARS